MPHQNEPPSFQQYMDSQYRDYSNFVRNRFGWGEPNRARAQNGNVRANQGRNNSWGRLDRKRYPKATSMADDGNTRPYSQGQNGKSLPTPMLVPANPPDDSILSTRGATRGNTGLRENTDEQGGHGVSKRQSMMGLGLEDSSN